MCEQDCLGCSEIRAYEGVINEQDVEIKKLRQDIEYYKKRLKPIEEVCDKMGKFLMKQTDACQNDADCVCPEMNDLIDEWQAIKAVGEK